MHKLLHIEEKMLSDENRSSKKIQSPVMGVSVRLRPELQKIGFTSS
jgi:hypothetical protein